ncbi:hypothetical protein BDN72DRAFT_583097 [Pluteus cervinus]|uniref:Uncharacterized protein n=1 Tax=Pluteus cervinus TaxID=181527 RepID=A0ACD3AWW3_9AGAR|nr:hypothetical protein BDN72DRAFT_583097 [Pluteus cervinus]
MTHSIGRKVKDLLRVVKPSSISHSSKNLDYDPLYAPSSPVSDSDCTSSESGHSFVLCGRSESSCENIRALPVSLTNQIPYEIYSLFMHFLKDDLTSLRVCSLVCHTWKEISQPLLFRLILRSRHFGEASRFKVMGRVHCILSDERTNTVLRGTSTGIYWCDGGRPEKAPIKVLNFADVRQMDVLNISGELFVIFRAGGYLYRSPMEALNPSNLYTSSPPRVDRIWAQDMDFYAMGKISNTDVIVIAKEERTVITWSPNRNQFVEFKPTNNYHVFPPVRPTSAFYSTRKYIVSSNPSTGYSTVHLRDVELTWFSQPDQLFEAIPTTAVALAPVKNGFLLCYDRFAVYLDKEKRLSGPFIHWRYPALRITFQGNHAFVFSKHHLEVRHLRTGQLVQLVSGPSTFQLLCGKVPCSHQMTHTRPCERYFAITC